MRRDADFAAVSCGILRLRIATLAWVDGDSEELIREALGRLMRGRTVVAIAHRLSTVRNFDRMVTRGATALQWHLSHVENSSLPL